MTRWDGDILSYKQNLIDTMDDDVEMAQSADNRNQMSLKTEKPKAQPKVSICHFSNISQFLERFLVERVDIYSPMLY